jgi:hypothetical protein
VLVGRPADQGKPPVRRPLAEILWRPDGGG